MTQVTQIQTIEELFKLWPRLATLTESDETPERVLARFTTCFAYGAVFTLTQYNQVIGSGCVMGRGEVLEIVSLPKDHGERFGKLCLEAIEEWARAHGYKSVIATTTGFSGSNYKYFEKSLGMRRKAVTFSKRL